MINSEKLKQRAKEKGIRQWEIANKLGLKQSTVNQKINNKRPMLLEEAEKIAELLDIKNADFADYFFSSRRVQRVKVGRVETTVNKSKLEG